MIDWCGGGGKSNDWLMRWYGNALCLALALALSLVLALALALTDDVVAVGKSNDCLIGGRGQVKWLTDVVVGASQMTDQCGNVVVEGKSNDWLMWWQGASQMIDWCGDMVTLYV